MGIGGPVGSGKTALMLSLCKKLRDVYSLVCVTNDIFTKEDGEFLVKNNALNDTQRIRAIGMLDIYIDEYCLCVYNTY